MRHVLNVTGWLILAVSAYHAMAAIGAMMTTVDWEAAATAHTVYAFASLSMGLMLVGIGAALGALGRIEQATKPTDAQPVA